MLYGIIIFFHIIVCVGLILVVLVQAGRGGGLAESFTGADSIFGTKTNAVLTRATTVFAVAFFITCLSLTFVSKQRSQSLLEGKNIKSSPAKKVQEKKVTAAAPAEEKKEEPKQTAQQEKKEEPKPAQEEKKDAPPAVQGTQAVESKVPPP